MWQASDSGCTYAGSVDPRGSGQGSARLTVLDETALTQGEKAQAKHEQREEAKTQKGAGRYIEGAKFHEGVLLTTEVAFLRSVTDQPPCG